MGWGVKARHGLALWWIERFAFAHVLDDTTFSVRWQRGCGAGVRAGSEAGDEEGEEEDSDEGEVAFGHTRMVLREIASRKFRGRWFQRTGIQEGRNSGHGGGGKACEVFKKPGALCDLIPQEGGGGRETG